MIFARIFSRPSLGVALVFLTAAFFAATPAHAEYKGAIVIDAATGQTLFEDNADNVSPPASVTKLMTFLIVHDAIAAGRLTLGTPVTANAVDQSMGGTQVNLAAGETFTVEELLYALMVESANDAAHALTHAASSDRAGFVALMNARAQGLGMKNTVFRSPHGLPPASKQTADGDLTSPRDLALLSRELVTRTDVLRYSAVRTRPFAGGVRAETLYLRNHNKLLGKVAGVDGLKTGYTRGAGFCLAATAQRGDQRIIVVSMGSPTSKGRDLRIVELIEKTFPLVPAGSVFRGYVESPISSSSGPATNPVATAPTAKTAPTPAADAPMVKFSLPPAKKK